MRRTELKRAAFKRKPVRVTLPLDDDLVVTIERIAPRLYRVPAVSGPREMVATPKRQYVRSEALLEAVRRVPKCMRCGRIFAFGERADPAHSNWSGHGKAGGIKADDNRIAAACRTCHSWMDASGDEWLLRFNAWWIAHVRTVRYLAAMNRWPCRVTIPDTHEFPKELV